jgi:chemotaxis protein methyltransferase WspC
MTPGDILRNATGLVPDAPSLERAIQARMRELGIARAADYTALLAGPELDQLAELLVVPESWMFRDPAAFQAAIALAERRLARDANAVVRILSVPCAGGEEPYSMAMALADVGVDAARWQIDAVDLSAASIRRGRAARYNANAFRSTDLAFRDRWFTQDGSAWVLRDEVRSKVRFSQGNLLELGVDANIARYDVIFCRNLLIYFDDEAIERAARVLNAMLADGGLLLAGPAETPALCRHGFQRLPLPGAFALHKPGGLPAELAPASGSARRVAREALQAVPPPTPTTHAPAKTEPSTNLLAQAQRQADAGDLRAAAVTCREQLAQAPTDAAAWFILGMVAHSEGDTAGAESHWRRCVYLDPDHYEALCALALLAQRAGDTQRAALYRRRATRARSAGGGRAT